MLSQNWRFLTPSPCRLFSLFSKSSLGLAPTPYRDDILFGLKNISFLNMRYLCRYVNFFQSSKLCSPLLLRPDSDLQTMNANSAAVWVKIVTSWLCVGIYVWSLIAPAVLSDRDFGLWIGMLYVPQAVKQNRRQHVIIGILINATQNYLPILEN